MKKELIIIIIFIAVQLPAENFKSPEEFEYQKQKTINHDVDNYNFDSNPFHMILKFYQKFISPVNQENCQMHPSCSEYAILSIREYGLLGILIAADRLNRCGHELSEYEVIIIDNDIKYFDPVR